VLACSSRVNNGQGVQGFDGEWTIPGTRKRVDAIDRKNKKILELKPNNPRAIADGERQVQGYVDAMNERFGGGWSGEVVTYQVGPNGSITYSR
jgi:hypothetical protein